MATWNFNEIKTKVRQVTGRLTPQELSDNELEKRINQYTQYTFPAELKLERQHVYYEFLTEENQPTYTFDNNLYTNVEPPAYIDNLSLLWYQDPAPFIETNAQQITRLTPWTGDGATTAFNTTVTGFPIYPGTLIITDEVEVFQDTTTTWTDQDINITGSLGGSATINLSTGVISVIFNTAPVIGQSISLSYNLFKAGRPTAVLYYDNQFTFYPVPNTTYRFKVKAYGLTLVKTAAGTTAGLFVNATDRPNLDQWGPCIAYGTSRDLHADYGEMDAYGDVTMLYKEQLAYVLKRTNQNLLNTRAAPNF